MATSPATVPVEMLPLDEIQTDNRYLRLHTQVDDLARSIEGIGLISPLIINEEGCLIAGGRRFSALKKLGFETAPVVRVSMNGLQQELLSIDENLQRKPLSGLELEACLRRGKEVYETLFGPDPALQPPEAGNDSAMAPRAEASVAAMGDDAGIGSDRPGAPPKRKGFIAEAAEKTGLSERAIEAAIAREESSADSVKAARRSGELGVRSTSELIVLDKADQDRILPYVRGKSYKEAQEIFQAVKDRGIEAAIAIAEAQDEHAPAFQKLRELVAKTRKAAEGLDGTQARYERKDHAEFAAECRSLASVLTALADERMGAPSTGPSYGSDPSSTY